MYADNKKGKDNPKLSIGVPQTGNIRSYSKGVNHDQRTTGLNHQTHPDKLQHRFTDKFGR